MKSKFLLIAFLAVATAFNISCSKDKGNESVKDNESIIGTWTFQSTKETGYEINDGKREEINRSEDVSSRNQTYTFNKDNTAVLQIWDNQSKSLYPSHRTYKIEGNKLTIIKENNEEFSTFSINGKTLTITMLEEEKSEKYEMKTTAVITLIKK